MRLALILLVVIFLVSSKSYSKVWRVSPDSEYKFCSDVAPLVEHGDTILIESDMYENDEQVTWRKDNLVIQGINGTPFLQAGDKILQNISNGKAIFVIQGRNNIIENIEFHNCKVNDNNGAGIRQEGANLTVRSCIFRNNEMGILCGSIPDCKIVIEYSQFYNNGSPQNPGYQHNIYINHIDTLIFRFNLSLNAAAEGHELKSRASNNYILYNVISNINTTDSRNIDLPNGGTAVILGNIIEQSQQSANSNIIGFGMEGLTNPAPHNLWISSNTIVNKKDRGVFVQTADIDTLFAWNNIFAGAKTGGLIVSNPKFTDTSNNLINDNIDEIMFVDAGSSDFHLTKQSPAVNSGNSLNKIIAGFKLMPEFEHDKNNIFRKREIKNQLDIGAIEFDEPVTVPEKVFSEFRISPNPAIDFITINLQPSEGFNPSEGSVVEIYDMLGVKVISELIHPMTSSHRMNLEKLPAGVYFIKIGDRVEKFVKM